MTKVLAIAILLASTLAAGAAARAADRSVVDGVFVIEQAARGAAAYEHNCTGCHGPEMTGDGFFIPQIGGPQFAVTWRAQTLADMYRFVTESMPFDNPGGLDPTTYAAILAYVLQFSGYPAGADDLPADAEALSAIAVEPAP